MKRIALISLIVFATQSLAQSAIPAGTILPVRLNSSLNSRKVKPGQLVTARVAQDVPLSSGSKIHAGTKVIGHIVDVKCEREPCNWRGNVLPFRNAPGFQAADTDYR